MIRRVSALFALAAAATLGLTACTPTVHIDPAANANAPECADVSVRLPKAIGNFDRVWTDAQATAVWGDDNQAVFRCGVDVPGPSTLQCVSFGGVDWSVDATNPKVLRMTPFGRSPAAQAVVKANEITGDQVLDALASAVNKLPTTGAACSSVDDATNTDAEAPKTDTGSK